MPVLYKRYLETYKSNLYIACCKKTKTLEYLAEYDIYEAFWRKIELEKYKEIKKTRRK